MSRGLRRAGPMVHSPPSCGDRVHIYAKSCPRLDSRDESASDVRGSRALRRGWRSGAPGGTGRSGPRSAEAVYRGTCRMTIVDGLHDLGGRARPVPRRGAAIQADQASHLSHLQPQSRVQQEMLDEPSRGVVVTAVFQELKRGFENGNLPSGQPFALQPRPLLRPAAARCRYVTPRVVSPRGGFEAVPQLRDSRSGLKAPRRLVRQGT